MLEEADNVYYGSPCFCFLRTWLSSHPQKLVQPFRDRPYWKLDQLIIGLTLFPSWSWAKASSTEFQLWSCQPWCKHIGKKAYELFWCHLIFTDVTRWRVERFWSATLANSPDLLIQWTCNNYIIWSMGIGVKLLSQFAYIVIESNQGLRIGPTK